MLKRSTDGQIDPSSVDKEKLEKLAYHYTRQIIHNTELQGFKLDTAVFRDFDLVFQALKSAFYRAADMHHPLQMYTDELQLLGAATAEQETE